MVPRSPECIPVALRSRLSGLRVQKQCHALDVKSLGKEVYGCHFYEFKGLELAEASYITRKCRRIAAHVGDGAGALAAQMLYDVFGQARAWWINDDDIGLVIWEFAACVASHSIDIVKSCSLAVAAQVTYSRSVALDGIDMSASAGKRQRERAGSRVEVHRTIVWAGVELREYKLDEALGAGGVYLEEAWGADPQRRVRDEFRPTARARQTLDACYAPRLGWPFCHDTHD